MEIDMARQPKAKAKQAALNKAPNVQYHCRCYALGDEYEMWVLDPKTGTYNGPIPCTKEQCLACNTSKAVVLTG
jgi:hypothetical protein